MRYAIVSDLHANLTAWQSVLTDLADLKADQIICLGDVVGYGPHPVGVLESVYRVVNVTLMGNHDAAVCGRLSTDNFSSRAAAAVDRHRGLLSASALEWLTRLPLTYEGVGFRCAHSEFSDPSVFHYVIAPEDALPSWRATPEQLLFVGHSHLPGIYVIGESGVPHFVNPCDFELEVGKRYLINPGSVGYPRVGDRRSSYCLYDDVTRSILFRQLPFDSASYRQAMHGAGLDDDPWIQQKELQQLPALRETPNFGKPGSKTRRPSAAMSSTAAREVGRTNSSDGATTSLRPDVGRGPTLPLEMRVKRQRKSRVMLLALVAGTALAAAITAFRAGRTTALPPLAITVPPYDLPARAAYPITPPDKNLLPDLPPALGPDGRLNGWRYAFEDRSKQTFSTGLRDAATTLCINHSALCKARLESPLIDLAGTGLRAVRLRGRIRKPGSFDGTVFYQIVEYETAPDDKLIQRRVQPYEMRSPKRKLSTPGADRDVRVPLGKQVTHVRFQIDAAFSGVLEIEQPHLTADTKGIRP